MKKAYVGGQAVMEGVMMKYEDQYAVAVRKPNKEIEVKTEHYESFAKKHKICRLPMIRGVVNFAESMIIGMQTLTYSASFFEEEEKPSKFEQWWKKVFGTKADDILMGLSLLLSFVIAIGLFMVLPYALSGLLNKVISSKMLILFLEGILRIVIFLAYIALISKMKEIQRVFQYHGAEHKTINCLEHGEDLTPENIKKYSRLHKRCGTSFLLIVMIVSIFFTFFIQTDVVILKILYRLLLIPVIAGVSYEFIRFAGKSDSKIVNTLSKPGMKLQLLTTREPDEDMIEVAIRSVEGVFDWKSYVKAVRNGEITE